MAEFRFYAEKCVGHALCNATSPEVYELDDSGYLLAPSEMVFDGDLQEPAVAGARACPEEAIRVIDDGVGSGQT